MTFAVGGALGAATWLFRPGAARALKQPPEVWALGVGGLFGYHALFFMALRLAPPPRPSSSAISGRCSSCSAPRCCRTSG